MMVATSVISWDLSYWNWTPNTTERKMSLSQIKKLKDQRFNHQSSSLQARGQGGATGGRRWSTQTTLCQYIDYQHSPRLQRVSKSRGVTSVHREGSPDFGKVYCDVVRAFHQCAWCSVLSVVLPDRAGQPAGGCPLPVDGLDSQLLL